MKIQYIKYSRLAILLLGVGFLSACSDFLDRVPQDEIVNETYWATQEHLEMAATGIYSRVKAKNIVDMENLGENTMWPSTNQYKDIGSGVFPVTQPTVNSEWANMYRDIRECNAFLENYQGATETDPGAKERLAAEVRVIRALAYSFLTSFYGDIPLITKSLNPGDPELYAGRDPQSQVVDFLLQELDAAAAVLPEAIPTGENLGRVSRGTALALKSRIALEHGRFEIAEQAAKAVMDMGVYELYTNGDPSTAYWELFTRAGKLSAGRNKETIFARLHLADVIMHNLSREIQVPDQFARFVPTRSLVESYLCADGLPIDKSPLYSDASYADVFKNRDPRMTQTILVPGDKWGGRYDGRPVAANSDPTVFQVPKFSQDGRGSVTTTGYYYKKYVEPTAVPNYNRDDNDIHHIRYAEVLLSYAEARMEQGKLTQADVDMSINLLRDRVGMKRMNLAFLAQNGMDVREEIRRERRIELALEGHRYFDVRRWKQGDLLGKDIEGVKADWFPQLSSSTFRKSADGYLSVQWNRAFEAPKNYLWPVPQTQYERNNNLGQNPGW